MPQSPLKAEIRWVLLAAWNNFLFTRLRVAVLWGTGGTLTQIRVSGPGGCVRDARAIDSLPGKNMGRVGMHAALLEVRSSWYEAYVAGDVLRLEALESPDFIAMGPHGMEERAHRLHGIANAVEAGRWFPQGSRAQDERLSWQAVAPDVVTAFGTGRIATPREQGSLVQFTELWRRTRGQWQVVQLHYSELPC